MTLAGGQRAGQEVTHNEGRIDQALVDAAVVRVLYAEWGKEQKAGRTTVVLHQNDRTSDPALLLGRGRLGSGTAVGFEADIQADSL